MHAKTRPVLAAVLSTTLVAQADWKQQSPTKSPVGHTDHVLAYDLINARTLMHAGQAQGKLISETWSYNGKTWSQINTTTSPSLRVRHAAAFDLIRARFVMFGGSTGFSSGMLGDTLEFDGKDWQLIKPTTSPSPRNDHWLCYDFGRGKIVLFGGRDSSTVYNETWEWNGTDWKKLTTKTSPPGRRDFNMVYDSVRKVIVVFGGFPGQGLGSPLSDTWEFDGTDWKQIQTKSTPPARGGHVMTYDQFRRRVVMFSGYPVSNDTWEYDGADWTRRAPTTSPSSRSGHAMAYDQRRQRIIMTAGWPGFAANDTWEYYTGNVGTVTRFGFGCKGSAGTPALDAEAGQRPWIGQPITLVASNLPSGLTATMLLGVSKTRWGNQNLPLNLGLFGLKNCTLYTSIDLVLPIAISNGTGRLTLRLPDNAWLIGKTLFDQVVVADQGAPGGVTLSNAIEWKIGAL